MAFLNRRRPLSFFFSSKGLCYMPRGHIHGRGGLQSTLASASEHSGLGRDMGAASDGIGLEVLALARPCQVWLGPNP